MCHPEERIVRGMAGLWLLLAGDHDILLLTVLEGELRGSGGGLGGGRCWDPPLLLLAYVQQNINFKVVF